MNLIKTIELEQQYLKNLHNSIKFYKKEIRQNKDRLGILKLDCKALIRTINEIEKTKIKLNKLYYKQNKRG